MAGRPHWGWASGLCLGRRRRPPQTVPARRAEGLGGGGVPRLIARRREITIASQAAAGRVTACSSALRWDQVVQADLAQPLEILGPVHVPQRGRLLPGQPELAEATAGLVPHAP